MLLVVFVVVFGWRAPKDGRAVSPTRVVSSERYEFSPAVGVVCALRNFRAALEVLEG